MLIVIFFMLILTSPAPWSYNLAFLLLCPKMPTVSFGQPITFLAQTRDENPLGKSSRAAPRQRTIPVLGIKRLPRCLSGQTSRLTHCLRFGYQNVSLFRVCVDLLVYPPWVFWGIVLASFLLKNIVLPWTTRVCEPIGVVFSHPQLSAVPLPTCWVSRFPAEWIISGGHLTTQEDQLLVAGIFKYVSMHIQFANLQLSPPPPPSPPPRPSTLCYSATTVTSSVQLTTVRKPTWWVSWLVL